MVCPYCGSEDTHGGFCLSCGSDLRGFQKPAPAAPSGTDRPHGPAAPTHARDEQDVASTAVREPVARAAAFEQPTPAPAAPGTPLQRAAGPNWLVVTCVLLVAIIAVLLVVLMSSRTAGTGDGPDVTTPSAAAADTSAGETSPTTDEADAADTSSAADASATGTTSTDTTTTEEPAVEEQPAVTAAPPQFTYATCSSYLDSDEFVATYYPDYVLDGSRETGWVEGDQSSAGIGEWVAIEANSPQTVSGVSIINGYSKGGDDELYYNNNRCRTVIVQLSDGYQTTATLSDVYDTWQDIDFGGTHQTTYVRVIIDSVYPGNRWDDTVIDELRAY